MTKLYIAYSFAIASSVTYSKLRQNFSNSVHGVVAPEVAGCRATFSPFQASEKGGGGRRGFICIIKKRGEKGEGGMHKNDATRSVLSLILKDEENR